MLDGGRGSSQVRKFGEQISDVELALQEKGRECFCTTPARLAGTGARRGSGGGGKGCCSNGTAGRA